MICGVSENNHAAEHKPPPINGPLSEEELTRRQLVRDVMNRLDYYDLKKSMNQGQRRINVMFTAQMPGEQRPGMPVPSSGAILAKIEKILMDLRAEEKKGSMRMKQIDIWLAEFGTKQADKTKEESCIHEQPTIVKFIEIANKA